MSSSENAKLMLWFMFSELLFLLLLRGGKVVNPGCYSIWGSLKFYDWFCRLASFWFSKFKPSPTAFSVFYAVLLYPTSISASYLSTRKKSFVSMLSIYLRESKRVLLSFLAWPISDSTLRRRYSNTLLPFPVCNVLPRSVSKFCRRNARSLFLLQDPF